jgi:hypothetical protein
MKHTSIVKQIDDILAENPLGDGNIPALQAAIDRLSPAKSYLDSAKKCYEVICRPHEKDWHVCLGLINVLKALREDYAKDRVDTFVELVRAEFMDDLLSQATYLLGEGYKQAAAVMAGGVLEQHLRLLCVKHKLVLIAKPKLDTMNADLAKISVYDKNEQKFVTAWAAIRNSAAHNQDAQYTDNQVEIMIQGVRAFVVRYPA